MRRFFQLTIPVWFVRTFLIFMLLLVLGSIAGTIYGVDQLSQDLPSLDSLSVFDGHAAKRKASRPQVQSQDIRLR
jgi:hypothetical protein